MRHRRLTRPASLGGGFEVRGGLGRDLLIVEWPAVHGRVELIKPGHVVRAPVGEIAEERLQPQIGPNNGFHAPVKHPMTQQPISVGAT
jgi:hypothetical protein